MDNIQNCDSYTLYPSFVVSTKYGDKSIKNFHTSVQHLVACAIELLYIPSMRHLCVA
jgi:hypothetical protein